MIPHCTVILLAPLPEDSCWKCTSRQWQELFLGSSVNTVLRYHFSPADAVDSKGTAGDITKWYTELRSRIGLFFQGIRPTATYSVALNISPSHSQTTAIWADAFGLAPDAVWGPYDLEKTSLRWPYVWSARIRPQKIPSRRIANSKFGISKITDKSLTHKAHSDDAEFPRHNIATPFCAYLIIICQTT